MRDKRTPKDVCGEAKDNLMTIKLTKTKEEMVVKGKVERPIPYVTFDIKQEE